MNAIFILSAVCPAMVCTVGFFILGGQKDPWRARLAATLFALCFAVGSFMLLGRFDLYDVFETFAWIAIGLAVFVWISPRPVGSRYLVRALFVLGCGYLALWHILPQLNSYVHHRNMAAFFFLALGVWSIMERNSQRVKTPALVLLPLLSAVTLIRVFNSQIVTQGLGQVAQILCAMYLGIFLLALWRPARVSVAAVMPYLSVFLVTFMAAGHFHYGVNPWSMVYLCIPFLVLWVSGMIPFVPQSPKGEAIGLGIIAAVPLAYLFWH